MWDDGLYERAFMVFILFYFSQSKSDFLKSVSTLYFKGFEEGSFAATILN